MILSFARNLHFVLFADAVTSAAAGLLMLGGAGILAPLLGLPEPLLRIAGLSLLPFAALVAGVAMRGPVSRKAVMAIAVVNAAWVAGSVLVVLSNWVAPTMLGHAFVLTQALAVALFAALQAMALRRQPGVAM